MHLLKTGWPRTACGRAMATLNLQVVESLSEVECKVCLARVQALGAFVRCAGEQIPVIQIEYWRALGRVDRSRHCGKNPSTRGHHRWNWTEFSKADRALLLDSIRVDPWAAWELNINGIKPEPITDEEARRLFRSSMAILQRVQRGKQDTETGLNKVIELQHELGLRLSI